MTSTQLEAELSRAYAAGVFTKSPKKKQKMLYSDKELEEHILKVKSGCTFCVLLAGNSMRLLTGGDSVHVLGVRGDKTFGIINFGMTVGGTKEVPRLKRVQEFQYAV